MKKLKTVMLAFAGVFFLCLAGGIKAEAADVLTDNIKLTVAGTISTNANGENILKTIQGKEYLLTEDSTIYTAGYYILTLNNTKPVTIDNINARNDLEICGSGTLNAIAKGPNGIYVGGYFKPFYALAKGAGTVNASGQERGILVCGAAYFYNGSVNGVGNIGGVWIGGCGMFVYKNASVKGHSDAGTGIYSKYTIYTYGNSLIEGTGSAYGIKSDIGCGIITYENSRVNATATNGCGLWTKGAVYTYKTSEINVSGSEFGLYTSSLLYGAEASKINGTSSNGIGIWAACDIAACTKSTISGTGMLSGVYSQKGCIYAYGICGGTAAITGTSNNIHSGYSAVHAEKASGCYGIKAKSKYSVIREVYNNVGLQISVSVPNNIRNTYSAIGRNMADMNRYNWVSLPEGVYNNGSGLLSKTAFSGGKITGQRIGTATCSVKTNEPVKLVAGAMHEVTINNVWSNGVD